MQYEGKTYLWEIKAVLMEPQSWQKMPTAEHFKNPQLKKEAFKYTIYSHTQEG